jgi:hypothetical protein
LFFVLGCSAEGLEVLRKFLKAEDELMFNPAFLAQMVLSPLNYVVDDVLLPLATHKNDHTVPVERNKKAKLNTLFRFDILCQMLGVLMTFGTKPDFKNQRHVQKLIDHPLHGAPAASSGENSAVCVTGFTAAFFLTLPELFVQWRNQKDNEDSNHHKCSIIRFTGEQCNWPTFSGKPCKGSLKSNPTSASPCRFLPEALDLETVFKVCLAGTLEWKTTSLCEQTKQQAARGPKEASEEAPEEQPEKQTEEQHQEQHQEPPAKAAKKVTKNHLAASGDAGDAQEKQGDSDGEELPSGSANEDQENSDNSSHSEAEQANAPHEPGEVAQTIPRKPKQNSPEHENTEQDTWPF